MVIKSKAFILRCRGNMGCQLNGFWFNLILRVGLGINFRGINECIATIRTGFKPVVLENVCCYHYPYKRAK